ncbi:MAG: LCP family protein [bacterium]
MDPDVKETPTSPMRPWQLLLGISLLLIAILSFFFLKNYRTGQIISGLVSDPAASLKSTNGRTNLVFLGMGGEGHEGGDLTDSMIFVSLDHATQTITLIPLPRDIWVDTMKAKLNTAYHYGNEKREGGGRDLAKSAVSEIIGQPVHYALALDFQGFIKAIDAVGGIDVEVERSFDDYKYPVPGKETAIPESDRYEHLHFEAGMTHMDGTTALKFARSRYAEGEEGTDFAREARQQKIILAFKSKLLETKTFLNLDTLNNVFSSFKTSIDTDIPESDYGSFLKFFLSFERAGQPLKSISLEEYFLSPKNKSPYQGQWVLIPQIGWQDIYDYVEKSL